MPVESFNPWAVENKEEAARPPLDENLLKDLSCPITLQIFYDPVSVIGCGHLFEWEAVQEYREQSENDPPCPLCKQHSLHNVSSALDVIDQIEALIREYPALQNDRYFTLEKLHKTLMKGNTAELEKLCAILKSSRHMDAESAVEELAGVSPVAMLALNPQGKMIIENDHDFRANITSESLNRVIQTGPCRGISAVMVFAADCKDRPSLIVRDPVLRAKVTREGLNTCIPAGLERGTSALFYVTSTREGRQVLLEDEAFAGLIQVETLMRVIPGEPYRGQSAYLNLIQTPEGQEFFSRQPALSAAIDVWREAHPPVTPVAESSRLFQPARRRPAPGVVSPMSPLGKRRRER
ncbi:MAG TPA: hypothetical protein VLJ15_05630 [Gammaproteobacteria bacterium]|nr:hypothetical protein [Gammaproteobacteria bacterium]